MFKLRSAQRRMAIDDTRYEKRVDHKPRAGRPHSRIILTEVRKTVSVKPDLYQQDLLQRGPL